MTISPTMTNTITSNTPLPVSLKPAKTNQMEIIKITMQQCKEFFDSEMAIFQARLKKQLNILLPSAAKSHNVNRPTTTWPPTFPSSMVKIIEESISKELSVLQDNLKKKNSQDMTAFHATKLTSSATTSSTNHPKIDNCTDKLPPSPFASSKQRVGFIA